MHQRAVGRQVAVLVEIEPALPGEEVAHLLQPHPVVGVKPAQVGETEKAEKLRRAGRARDERSASAQNSAARAEVRLPRPSRRALVFGKFRDNACVFPGAIHLAASFAGLGYAGR